MGKQSKKTNVGLVRFNLSVFFNNQKTTEDEVRLRINSFIDSIPNYYLNMEKLKSELKNSIHFSSNCSLLEVSLNTGNFLVSSFINDLVVDKFYEEFSTSSFSNCTWFSFSITDIWEVGRPKDRFKNLVIAPIEEALFNLRTRGKFQS